MNARARIILALSLILTAVNLFWMYSTTEGLHKAMQKLDAERFQEFTAGASCGSMATLEEVQEQAKHGAAITIGDAAKGRIFNRTMELRKQNYPKLPEYQAQLQPGTNPRIVSAKQ